MDPDKALVMQVDSVGFSAHRISFGGVKGILHTDVQWSQHFHVGGLISIKGFQTQWYEGELQFYAMSKDGAMIFMHASEKRGRLNTMETFAGLAGWTQVLKHFDDQPVLLVEADLETAKVCAAQMDAPCIDAKSYVDRVLNGEHFPVCVLADKVENPLVWVAAGLANVDRVVGSPPCQPWSGAGNNKGLTCEDGRIFLTHLEWAVFMRISVVVVENVAGLPKHGDFKEMVRKVAEQGLTLRTQGVFACHQLLPVRRDRWLGTFVSNEVVVDEGRVKIANYVNFASCMFACVAKTPKLGTFDMEHKRCQPAEREELMIPNEALQLLGDPDVAPWWLKGSCAGMTHDALIEGRVVKVGQQCPCFMATYGKQHELDMSLLKEKGLQTMLIRDGQGIRMLSPWEMLAAMAYKPETILSSNVHEAWKQAGNGLSAVHAWLAIHRTCVLLGKDSPWVGHVDPAKHVLEVVQAGMQLSCFESVKAAGLWKLVECDNEPAAKKSRNEEVPPTVPIQVDDEDEDGVASTKAFEKCPKFVQANDPRWNATLAAVGGNKLVILEHMEKHWVMFVNVREGDKIGTTVRKGMPHADACHFLSLRVDDVKMEWNQALPNKAMQKLVFDPVFSVLTCREESMPLTLKLQADVTWTARTALSYMACEVGCNPESLSMFHGRIEIPDNAFLGQYDTVEFDLKFKACLPAYVSWERSGRQVKDPGFVPSAHDARWCVRHPNRKIVRTCAADAQATVSGIVQMLFPDLHANTPWSVFSDTVELAPNAQVNSVVKFTIQGDGARPFPRTEVTKVRWTQEIDTPSVQSKIVEDCRTLVVRSPFRAKPCEIKCPNDATVAEIAASYLTMSKVFTSMIASQNGQVVDPLMRAEYINEAAVLDVRICPLMGGGKAEKNEMLKSKLKSMLTDRGVPQDAVVDRVTDLLSKIQYDKLNALGDPQEAGTWKTLKELASEARFRLILPAELKAFQQKNRKEKPSTKSEVKKPKTFTPEAHAIQVDPAHFQAEGKKVQMLETSRFGPDQSGLCIVSPAEAQRCMQVLARSCDPLALLVIGEGVQQLGSTFSMPAHLSNVSPVIVKACLLQFGDTDIEFKLQLPMADVVQTASTVIEFGIYKNFVGSWQDTAVPLHYVGVHVPALRGNNLLAVWSVKAWNDNKVVHHQQANHWHGYFRVADVLLAQVLPRSGSAGIFMNPKTLDKKHDPRYTTVSLPAKQLSEVMAKAEACSKALGIAKIGENFAIRCLREDAICIRAQLLPESAFVETATCPQDQVLFVARNVPQVCREELTEALKKTGWEATAVRPQGMSRWIIAAKSDPANSHVIINGAIMMVERLNKGQDSVPITMVAREVRVNTTQENGVVSTTSRFAEFRAQVETQISQAVEAKLQMANTKIEQLTHALQEVQNKAEMSHSNLASDLGQVREEQAFTQKKLAEVESTVASNGQQIIAQMQNMFTKMQANMEQTVQALVNDPDKRQKTEAKNDPFAKKA